ncbi:MAG: class I SAM-dependent methyltransferase [Kiritimatiellaceae bacterium]|nr:class I SAM-dependent methyltransferase [Kiritimatiellaceae bacterium]
MTKQESISACPLCANGATELFHRDRKREYFHCPQCDLVFVPPEFHLSPEAEKARYDFHSQSLADSGYREFLNRLFRPFDVAQGRPLQKKLSPGACGLDFGCGQEPTLSVLFEEAGYACDNYDLHFANDPAVLEKQYDFLTCSETMEHFCRPREEFERFLRLVKPGGWIGIMTQLRDDAPTFDKWFYKDDATHVCFFSRRSFQWLKKQYGLHLEFHPDGVVLFQQVH